jgi:hypothetical protein
VANPVSYSTTFNKVVWGKTSIEVNHLSRILFRISLAKPKAKSKKMSPTDPVEEEEKVEAEVEAEPRSEKEEENLGKDSPKDISNTHLLSCSVAILDDLPDKMVTQVFQPSLVWLAPKSLIKLSNITEQAWASCQR